MYLRLSLVAAAPSGPAAAYRVVDFPSSSGTIAVASAAPQLSDTEVQLRLQKQRYTDIQNLAHLIQCAPTARFTSGGRIHPGSCR